MKLQTKDRAVVIISSRHMKQHEEVLPLLPEVLSMIVTNDDPFIRVEVDLGRIAGNTSCVETAETDDILFARRVGRRTITRFVRNRQPVPTRHVTVLMLNIGQGVYRLVTGWIGRLAEKEPTDPTISSEAERARAEAFWSNHALVWGTQEVIGGH